MVVSDGRSGDRGDTDGALVVQAPTVIVGHVAADGRSVQRQRAAIKDCSALPVAADGTSPADTADRLITAEGHIRKGKIARVENTAAEAWRSSTAQELAAANRQGRDRNGAA